MTYTVSNLREVPFKLKKKDNPEEAKSSSEKLVDFQRATCVISQMIELSVLTDVH
jgi:hypothetical protein